MTRIVAVHQPNYLPWLGFFYKMERSDVFFLLDTVQYSSGSPANRNFILGRDGKPMRLTASVKKPHRRAYSEIELDYSSGWNMSHLKSIRFNYSATAFFERYYTLLENALLQRHATLADLNISLINFVKTELGIETEVKVVSELSFGDSHSGPNELLIALCKHVGGTAYLSGTGAQKYNDADLFKKHNLELVYSDFSHPEYAQSGKTFVPNLSVVDLMFNEGDRSLDVLRRKVAITG